jgi:hypothetical protein
MGGRGRADGLIVAVAVACGLEPWILADFDSAGHEPYSSPCNVSHVHGEATKKQYVRSYFSTIVHSQVMGAVDCSLSSCSNRRSPAVSQKRMAAQHPSTLGFRRPGVRRLAFPPPRGQEGKQAQIASLLFIALESRIFAYLECGDFPYITRSYILLSDKPSTFLP